MQQAIERCCILNLIPEAHSYVLKTGLRADLHQHLGHTATHLGVFCIASLLTPDAELRGHLQSVLYE